MWFGLRDDDMGRLVWVFSVEIDPAFRGRGLGRAAMEFVEAEARRRGYGRVSLNVMEGNTVARGLYRSLGYDEVALVLGKDVLRRTADGRRGLLRSGCECEVIEVGSGAGESLRAVAFLSPFGTARQAPRALH